MTEQNPPTGATMPPPAAQPAPQVQAQPAQAPQGVAAGMPPMLAAQLNTTPPPQAQAQAQTAATPLEIFSYRATIGDTLESFTSESLNLTIYWRPETMAQRDRYIGDLISDEHKMRGFVKCLFFRALNADGSRMFVGKPAFEALMNSDKCDEIIDVVNQMLGDAVKNELDEAGND